MSPKITEKSAELREMGIAQLRQRLAELRQELLKLRIQRVNQQLKNPLRMREVRRGIARILTIMKEKEHEGPKS